jgi:hypothetical protein
LSVATIGCDKIQRLIIVYPTISTSIGISLTIALALGDSLQRGRIRDTLRCYVAGNDR